jgi:hypothetical protein
MTVIILAMVILLVLALLSGTMLQSRTSQLDEFGLRARQLADTAEALVEGQINQASTQTGQAWISCNRAKSLKRVARGYLPKFERGSRAGREGVAGRSRGVQAARFTKLPGLILFLDTATNRPHNASRRSQRSRRITPCKRTLSARA